MSTLLAFKTVMEKLQLLYLSNNIPISSNWSYKLQLIEKIGPVIKRMRWKAFFYEQRGNKYISINHGLKSLNYPPKTKEMTNFENGLTNLLKNINLRVKKSFFPAPVNRCYKHFFVFMKFIFFFNKFNSKITKNNYTKVKIITITVIALT